VDLSAYNPDVVDGINQIEAEQQSIDDAILASALQSITQAEDDLNKIDGRVQQTILKPLNNVIGGLNEIYTIIHQDLEGRIATSNSAIESATPQTKQEHRSTNISTSGRKTISEKGITLIWNAQNGWISSPGQPPLPRGYEPVPPPGSAMAVGEVATVGLR